MQTCYSTPLKYSTYNEYIQRLGIALGTKQPLKHYIFRRGAFDSIDGLSPSQIRFISNLMYRPRFEGTPGQNDET